jgi:hypothetical protein
MNICPLNIKIENFVPFKNLDVNCSMFHSDLQCCIDQQSYVVPPQSSLKIIYRLQEKVIRIVTK